MARTQVASWDEALDAIVGREVVLDGVHGTIEVEHVYSGSGARIDTRVHHEPNVRGKRSEAYQRTKALLRDDWSMDLSWSDRLVDLMIELGIEFVKCL
jgi:hypothetical protein